MTDRKRRTTSTKKAAGFENNDVERRKRRKKKADRERQMIKMGLGGIVVLILTIIIFIFTRKTGVNILVNGESVAQVKDKKITAEYVINTVEAQLASEYGTQVEICEEIVVEKARVKKDNVVSTEYAISAVRNAVTYNVLAGVLYVNGSKLLAMDNLEALNALLDELKKDYVPEGSEIISATFVDDVKAESGFVDKDTIINHDTAKAKLTQGVPTKKTYSVKSGDSFYLIASKNGITVESLLEANPGMTIDTKIKVGDTLNLVVSVPFLSVKTVEEMTYTEKDEKKVEYRTNSAKDSSYKKVIQQGRDGQKEVTVQVIRINGFEEEQKVISEVTTVEPVTEIIEVGGR